MLRASCGVCSTFLSQPAYAVCTLSGCQNDRWTGTIVCSQACEKKHGHPCKSLAYRIEDDPRGYAAAMASLANVIEAVEEAEGPIEGHVRNDVWRAIVALVADLRTPSPFEAKEIRKPDGTSLEAGDLKEGQLVKVTFDKANTGPVAEIGHGPTHEETGKRVHVFIVEDDAVAREMIEQHFKGTGAITFASIHEPEERPALVDAINSIG